MAFSCPIRPIIMGGDDITFVSPGKLGIYFAEIFMKEFSEKEVSDGEKLSSCAGVAITKTKYPFYRGYQLAEGLCSNAKKMARKKKKTLPGLISILHTAVFPDQSKISAKIIIQGHTGIFA